MDPRPNQHQLHFLLKKKVSKENPFAFLSLPPFSTASILSNFQPPVKNNLAPDFLPRPQNENQRNVSGSGLPLKPSEAGSISQNENQRSVFVLERKINGTQVSFRPQPEANRVQFILSGDPCGNRTHVCGVRGRRLNRLTNGPSSSLCQHPQNRTMQSPVSGKRLQSSC